MNILIVGGDTRLLDSIENTVCPYCDEADISKVTALNKAILECHTTSFDLIICALQLSKDDNMHLSETFRDGWFNSVTPIISMLKQEQKPNSSSQTFAPNLFVNSIEELQYIFDDILAPSNLGIAA